MLTSWFKTASYTARGTVCIAMGAVAADVVRGTVCIAMGAVAADVIAWEYYVQ